MLSIITHTESAVSSPIGPAVVVLCASSKHQSRDPRSVATERGQAVCGCVCLCACAGRRRKVAIEMDGGCSRRRGHGRRPGHTAFMCRCSGTVNKHGCEREMEGGRRDIAAFHMAVF